MHKKISTRSGDPAVSIAVESVVASVSADLRARLAAKIHRQAIKRGSCDRMATAINQTSERTVNP